VIIVSGGLLVTTDGWPLTYPSWFSALDRRRIDDALSAAAASATQPATPATAPAHPLTGPVHGRLFASEAAAIAALLQVFRVVVHVLSTPRDGEPDADTRRRVADQLFYELVVWIADLTPAVTTGAAWAGRVREALERCEWWTAFAAPASAVPVPAAPEAPPDADSPLLTLKEAAAQLSLSPKTLKEMARKGELNIFRPTERKLRVRQTEVNRLLALDKYRYR